MTQSNLWNISLVKSLSVHISLFWDIMLDLFLGIELHGLLKCELNLLANSFPTILWEMSHYLEEIIVSFSFSWLMFSFSTSLTVCIVFASEIVLGFRNILLLKKGLIVLLKILVFWSIKLALPIWSILNEPLGY